MIFSGYSIAVSLVSIMIAISGIIFGVGIAIEDKRLKDFGKEELYQALISGFIVGTLFVLVAPDGAIYSIINNFVSNSSTLSCSSLVSCLTSPSSIKIANASYPSLMSTTLSMIFAASALYGSLSLISSLSFSIALVSISFNQFFQPILHQLNMALSTLSIILASIEAQAMLLVFISIVTLPILLPAGIILRTVYFTRRLGGTIIALSVALFLVFPLTLITSFLTLHNSNRSYIPI